MQKSINTEGQNKERTISATPLLPAELSNCLTLIAKEQNKQAFTLLFKHFGPKIKRFGLEKFANEASAKELVQETMTNIWKKSHMYNPDKGAATTWVYTIMRNAAFDMLRKIKSRSEQNLSDDLWPIDAIQEETYSNDDIVNDHLLTKQLSQYVERLPSAQQVVVKGVYFQELSQEQLAQQLGVPLGTVKSRLRVALEKLRQHMGDTYHD
jgi:RNA polymerase sigma-70 factor (ECF subfamily)